jgi:sigma-B regulation protein RsbU (phosphoserine phosphatase)
MGKPKILIVDDEPFNVDYLEQELVELNYVTESATNGQEALEKVAAGSPDLILLDIMMPIMDGFEVLSRLKIEERTLNIPVIVISANSDLKSIVRGIELGAEDYLPKPFQPALLKARISSSLEKKHLRDLEQQYLKSLERELEIGHQIQLGFLPNELPKVDGWEIAAYFKSAREVAGDFYDVFLLPDGNLLSVIGDVCDKGVGAALFMALFRSLIRTTATSDLSSDKDVATLIPAQRLKHIISYTNNYITTTHGDASMYATIFIGIFEPKSGTLAYMNCGHEPPYWVSSGGSITPLLPTGPLVGVLPEAEFTTTEIVLESGDLILAFTDGVQDAINENDESFGKERILEVLRNSDLSPNLLIQEIDNQRQLFIDGAKQFDDITMLAMKRAGQKNSNDTVGAD